MEARRTEFGPYRMTGTPDMIPCFAVSTVGRIPELTKLLDSLVKQNNQNFYLGICDQSRGDQVARLAESYKDKLRIFVTSSEKGLSAGRNSIIRNAPSDCTHFLFPNDTTYYVPEFIERLSKLHSTADIVALPYIDDDGQRYVFAEGYYPIDHRNVWRIIEAGMVVSATVFRDVGFFDRNLGTGSHSPWQSGEGTDLLLRASRKLRRVHWDTKTYVYGVSQQYGLTDRQRRRKLREYGRGYGYLHRRWQYSIVRQALICLSPLLKAIRTGNRTTVLDGAYSSLGRFEGVAGWRVTKP